MRAPSTTLALALALLLGPAAPPSTAFQGLSDGLDVVLLVDVSRSMYTSRFTTNLAQMAQDPPDGTDHDRIRWDAVQIVLNLLTADDRILILPFNDEAPAFLVFGGTVRRGIPGDLPQQLLPVGQHRRRLIEQVEPFIHTRGDTPPNTDWNGTAILKALRKSAELATPERATPGRKVVAILLTDGREDNEQKRAFPGLGEDPALRAYLGPWARPASGRPGSPVYPIGLGSQQAVADGRLDLEYLRRIANLTGGQARWVEKNSQLIEAFRDLVWQLKGSWIKPVDRLDGRPTEDTMRGIVDLGILAYSERPEATTGGRVDPRNTTSLSTRPRFAWDARGARDLPPEARAGRKASYDYWYFGRPSAAEGSPFREFAEEPLRLATTWGPPAPGEHVAFAKRTARPLFELDAANLQAVPRHQELAVRVRMSKTDYFQPGQFRLTAGLALQGDDPGASGPAAEVLQVLDEDTPGRGFGGSFRLDDPRLPRGRRAKDYYALRVVAEGLADPAHSLSRYRLDLPGNTVAVDNTIVLEPIDRVELTREAPTRRVEVRSRAAIRGELPLKLALTAPRSSKVAVPADLVTVRQVDPGSSAGRLLLRDGAATLEFALNPGRIPPGRVVYDDGQLGITAEAGAGLEPRTVPVGLRIGLAELEVDPTRCELRVEDRGVASPPIRVGVAGAVGLSPSAGTLRVAIGPQSGRVRFGPDELWIEPEGRPSAGRSQSTAMAPGSTFRVRFEPKPDPSRRGRQELTWVVSAGDEANPRAGTLILDYQAPRLVGPAGPIRVVAGRGERGRGVSIPVRLAGLPGEKCPVVFRPDRSTAGRVAFARKGAPAGPIEAGPSLVAPGSGRAVEVVAGADGEVHLDLNVPDDLPFGTYEARGVLAGERDDVREAPVTIEVAVNAIEVLVAAPGRGDGWEAVDRVPLGQFIGRDLPKVLRVRTGRHDPLDPGDLRVRLSSTFENDDGDPSRPPEPPTEADVRAVEGGEALEVTLRFPAVRNADPFKPYRVKAVVECPRLADRQELPAEGRTIEFVVTYLTARPLR